MAHRCADISHPTVFSIFGAGLVKTKRLTEAIVVQLANALSIGFPTVTHHTCIPFEESVSKLYVHDPLQIYQNG